jgi:hypothetical protein
MLDAFLIEEGIRPLVEALNRRPYAATVYSCEGHFDAPPNPKFLPTAYVTFDVNDPEEFRLLHERLLSFSALLEAGSVRLTYDCFLGRYTLSVWADGHCASPGNKSEATRSLVARLAEVVEEEPAREVPAFSRQHAAAGQTHPAYCLSESSVSNPPRIAPCALIIPQRAVVCPFVERAPEKRQ